MKANSIFSHQTKYHLRVICFGRLESIRLRLCMVLPEAALGSCEVSKCGPRQIGLARIRVRLQCLLLNETRHVQGRWRAHNHSRFRQELRVVGLLEAALRNWLCAAPAALVTATRLGR